MDSNQGSSMESNLNIDFVTKHFEYASKLEEEIIRLHSGSHVCSKCDKVESKSKKR